MSTLRICKNGCAYTLLGIHDENLLQISRGVGSHLHMPVAGGGEQGGGAVALRKFDGGATADERGTALRVALREVSTLRVDARVTTCRRSAHMIKNGATACHGGRAGGCVILYCCEKNESVCEASWVRTKTWQAPGLVYTYVRN